MTTIDNIVESETALLVPGHLSAADLRWFGFVRDLMPWQFHWLMKSEREINLHDAYIQGRPLDQIYSTIIKETQHLEPRTAPAQTQD